MSFFIDVSLEELSCGLALHSVFLAAKFISHPPSSVPPLREPPRPKTSLFAQVATATPLRSLLSASCVFYSSRGLDGARGENVKFCL